LLDKRQWYAYISPLILSLGFLLYAAFISNSLGLLIAALGIFALAFVVWLWLIAAKIQLRRVYET
jgi:hypothetical protein